MPGEEIRQNKLTGDWVIYAPVREQRPRGFRSTTAAKPASVPTLSPQICPFCPGHEDQIPPILFELPSRNTAPWQTRVIPNKFPALTPNANGFFADHDFYQALPARGRHEVIIESPHHEAELPTMPPASVEALLETYLHRYHTIRQAHDHLTPFIFRNHGYRAGTSQPHPHSQLIASPVVPPLLQRQEDHARQHFETTGRCLLCTMVEHERASGQRVVCENEAFLAFVPYATAVPFELWLVPKQHRADFGDISDAEKRALVPVLQTVLQRLNQQLNDPDYNYWIHSSTRYRSQVPDVHWHLQIRPRYAKGGGFEAGSGIQINPTLPEANAAVLRLEQDAD